MSTTTALAVALIAVSVLDIAMVLTVVLKNHRIATLQRQLATALGIIGERDDVIRELETANARLDARNERLHHDMKAMRERLPVLAPDDSTAALRRRIANTENARLLLGLDEDVTRRYVREPIGEVWPEVGEELR